MHHSHEPRLRVVLEHFEQPFVGHTLAPGGRHFHHVRAVAPRNLGDALAEVTGAPHDHGVARLDQVRDARLHAGRAGGLDGEHDAVVSAVYLAQVRDYLEQDLVEVGIEVAEHRGLHRLEHGGGDNCWGGAA